MSRKTTNLCQSFAYAYSRTLYIIVCTFLFLVSEAAAISRTWDNGGSGDNWAVNNNWSPDGTEPNAIGDEASFNGNFSAVDLNMNVTLGTLDFEDNSNWDIAVNSGQTIRMEVSSGSARLRNTGASGAPVVNPDIIIADRLQLTLTSSGALTLNGNIDDSGTRQFQVYGGGEVIMTGNNTNNGAYEVYDGSTVTFNGTSGGTSTSTTENFLIDEGNVNMNNGFVFTHDDVLKIGMNSNVGRLTIDGAGTTMSLKDTATTNDIELGSESAGTGYLTVSDTATLSTLDGLKVAQSVSSYGSASIESGAYFYVDASARVGQRGTGIVTVTGSGSHMELGGGVFDLGSDQSGANGLLELNSGALLTANNSSTELLFGANSNSTGSFVATGAGTTALLHDVKVGDASTNANLFKASNSAVIDIADNLQVADNSNSNGAVTIESGADLTVGNTLRVAVRGTGEITVTGSNSSFTHDTGNDLQVSTNSGSNALLQITGGALMTATNASHDVYVGMNTGSIGSMNVAGAGTTALLNNLTVGYQTAAANAMKISETAVVTAAGTFTVGDDAIANATVTIESGGSMEVTGTTTIGNNGTGVLTVTGTNSSFTGGTVNVGANAGATGTLTLASNGKITATTLNVQQTGTFTGDNISVGNTTDKITTLNIETGGVVSTTGTLSVDTGGTLNLNRSDGITGGDMNLGGGTFNTGGNDQTAGNLGKLTITATSTIDMGASDSIINWTVIDEGTWTGTLIIHNWTGTKATAGGTDQLIFTDITNFDKSAQIWFYSGSGTGLIAQHGIFKDIGGGKWELVPAPEPAAYCGVGLLLSFALWRERKRLMRIIGCST